MYSKLQFVLTAMIDIDIIQCYVKIVTYDKGKKCYNISCCMINYYYSIVVYTVAIFVIRNKIDCIAQI